MRRPILAANWKMHKTVDESLTFINAFLPMVQEVDYADIVLIPPFTALECVGNELVDTPVELAAQNVHPENKGAFTGEISPLMLKEFECIYTLVGHSERRQLFGEENALIARKAAALLGHGIRPIVCIGETLEEREADRTFEVLANQLKGSLAEIEEKDAEKIVLAYEPVWAIGTGKTATPEDAQEVHAFLRKELNQCYGEIAEKIRIQYGGSVKPDNVSQLMEQSDIDGALVGGAGLDPDSFAAIVRFNEAEEKEW